VAYFASEQDVYDHIGRSVLEITRDAELAPRLAAMDSGLQSRYRDPAATVTVSARPGAGVTVEFGSTATVPEIVFEAEADRAHEFWLGVLDLTVALALDQSRASGPVHRILELVPVLEPFRARYRARVEAEGRPELLAPLRGAVAAVPVGSA